MTEQAKRPVNYTPEMVENMVSAYTENPLPETVDALAAEFGKSRRSIIAKLSAEGVYIKQERVGKTKTGADVIKKSDLVAQINAVLSIEIPSLEKVTKSDLQTLLKAVS